MNKDGVVKFPICDFHSIDDEVVLYAGSMNMASLVKVTLCKKKDKHE